MSPRRVRVLFGAVGLGLILQYAAVGLFGLYGTEPWPAVVLPGFKTVYNDGDAILVERPVIYTVFANGERVPVPPSRFLSPLPRSHHPSFLRAQCRPAVLSGTQDTERCRMPDGRRWMFDRAAAVFPTRSIREVTVRWEQLQLDVSSGQRSIHPLDSLSLSPLSEDSAEAVAVHAPILNSSTRFPSSFLTPKPPPRP
jgi:hypothetical protein